MKRCCGATDVKYYVSKRHQALLNPQGVNCIRDINGNITVSGRAHCWRRSEQRVEIRQRAPRHAVPAGVDRRRHAVGGVRAERSGAVGARFGPTSAPSSPRVWQSGALFGPRRRKPSTSSATRRPTRRKSATSGQVVIEVGVAIVRPAEFVIFRITQWTGPTKS